MNLENKVSKEKKEKKELLLFKHAKLFGILFSLALISILGINIVKSLSIDGQTTKLGFEDIGELTTQVAYTTNVEVIDESKKIFNKIEIPFTQSKYIFSYNVEIKAGINFEKLNWNKDEKNKTITISMPEAEILGETLLFDSFKIYHEQESIFCRVSLKDINDSQQDLVDKARTDAIANGLLTKAEENAKTLIVSFLGQEYNLNEWNIEFK
ncbi:MAG: DUF4230 domain-containing protein [Traorella sp.]